jgi:hypothetical protein
MKDEFYTPDGRHPDDAILEVQKFIQELSKVQDAYFQKLVTDLKLTPKGADYLFDFVYNCGEDDNMDSFEEYLERYSRCDYEDIVE